LYCRPCQLYLPHLPLLSFPTRRSSDLLLGLIVREITDPFFTAMLNVIALEARRRGYNLVLGDARSSAEEAQALTQVLEVRHCEADRKSTRLNSSHQIISYAVFCLKKKT